MSLNNGAELCARFAYKPNQLQYCGSDSAQKSIYDCIVYNKCDNLEKSFNSFKGLYAYLQLISEKLDLPLLDYQVTEAYWIGNERLEEFDANDFYRLMELFIERNVPELFVDQLKEKFEQGPKIFYPYHSFNVLFVGVGNVTNSVEFNLKNINNCIIRPARILEIDRKKNLLKIATKQLISTKELKYDKEIRKVSYIPEFFDELKEGNDIAIHWKDGIYLLKEKESKSLEFWTNKVISDCLS